MANLSLSIIEIIVLMLGAVILGITIHFFFTNRRGMKNSSMESDKVSKHFDEWKLKYFNDIEMRDKELGLLRQRASEAEENAEIYTIESDELRRQNKILQSEIEQYRKAPPPTTGKTDYIDQLRQAQSNLMEHNEKINQLLEQIDLVKEMEETQQEIMRNNEELSGQIASLKFLLNQKEREVDTIRQKENLTKEMTSMLDNAYSEFDILQTKIQKLESQVTNSKRVNMDYEDLKEGYVKITSDLEEYKSKVIGLTTQNQDLDAQLKDAEDKLREANFQRQQLLKRVSYLEELNNDLQAVTDANKKLEGQLKRIGELESRLNMVSEERDELARRQINE